MTERTALSIQNGEHQDRVLLYHQNRCHSSGSNEPVWNSSGTFCPKVWDNATCWPATRAGELAVQPCPPYLVGVNVQGNASKQCMEDGRWYVSPRFNRHWTNMTGCTDGPVATIIVDFQGAINASYFEEYLTAVKVISRVGYSLSLVTLLLALTILATNKRLRCPRNIVHMHLLSSFILKASMVLLKDYAYKNGVGLSSNVLIQNDDAIFVSNSMCKIITSLWHYSVMANYSWILMEGLYLHNLIFLALFSDTSSIVLYVILGWGLPVIFLALWIGIRIGLDNYLCWVTGEAIPLISLIIEVPITVSIMINTVLFINIVRVLLHKIKATFVEKPQTYRKWAKSTLVLVPLFGIHYLLFVGMVWVPKKHLNATAETVWLFYDKIFSSFQGLVVAVLYCFLNGEVKTELSKTWQNMQWKKSSGRKLSTFAKSSSIHGTYCTTASCASLNSLKWGNSRVVQPAQLTSDKKISPFYPQFTETTRLNSYGKLNAVDCEEKEWHHPGGNGNNIELGCLIP